MNKRIARFKVVACRSSFLSASTLLRVPQKSITTYTNDDDIQFCEFQARLNAVHVHSVETHLCSLCRVLNIHEMRADASQHLDRSCLHFLFLISVEKETLSSSSACQLLAKHKPRGCDTCCQHCAKANSIMLPAQLCIPVRCPSREARNHALTRTDDYKL